jgi:beta-lactamase superfamily II metal-dependent hydrolase
MMTTEPLRLEIHVLGADRGESIILRLPDGGWGVVDCCARSSSDRRKNATYQFLQEQGVTELEFLCLTHPHDDHYRGMSHLFETFPVRYFWRFNGLSGPHFVRLIEYLRAESEAIDRFDEIESAREFERIFDLIGENKRGKRIPSTRVKRVGSATQLYPVPYDEAAPLRIIGLAPSGNQVERYERGLAQCYDSDGTIRARLPQAHHNLVSIGLLVIFGETRVILGGDVERAGWKDVIVEIGTAALATHAVKVSHHGSPNAYCDGLWSHLSAKGKPLAVVTAYTAQSLPRQTALDHIRPHVRAILTTCLTALKDEQLPAWTDPETSRLRLALMAKMGRFGIESHHQCGRCSLIFDDRGQCVGTESIGPAGAISVGPDPEIS